MFSDESMYILILLILIIILVGIIGWVIVRVKTSTAKIRLAEADIDKKKLELMMKRVLIEDLKNASVILNDKERIKLDSIQTDNAILSRKTIFLMNEVENRTKRLELGSNLGKLNMSLGKIRQYESKLFGNRDTVR
ncbi:MAG: hypothetical protein JSV49_10680 [Thermoplasmata archaeon]|nr:MAG: hypothetical protein JSV49_10680 [Thermoplasmata archaeon]